ncbi:hypothetical protein QR680_014419 [Steinernema hermaphroditum]|uniref:NF-X1-type domain-containing protein n=1 Tax=Steinernema hermaphroditum TaxID=289476 RepID=A0AA39M354_9BILA|nr:hypothetical protein QR680_014419 [Steinernema hermaphroditum]
MAAAVVHPPPEDFRTISVVPTKEDMLVIDKPYLRKNVTKGHYDDGDHYLDVQFRLLREDLLDPLRSGVNSYRSAAGTRGKGDVYVYENVKIGYPRLDMDMGEMVFPVQFKPRHRCRWIRQMIFGSLVVLSKDGFEQDFIFGTVAIRDLFDLQEGFVKLLLPRMDDVDHKAEYRMIESSAYYEAYHHVLRGLQTFAPGEDIPFHKYLVDLNTEPGVPSYFIRNNYRIDFGVICAKPDEKGRRIVDVRHAHEEVSPDDIYLDESQHKALMMTFQHELAVIQGPPGTGKTFIGHQITRVLLANQQLWNPDRQHPMLVVCYTNHALDQFLSGIMYYMVRDTAHADPFSGQRRIVRVGSRCRNPDLRPYTLHEIARNCNDPVPRNIAQQRCEARTNRQNVAVRIAEVQALLNSVATQILPIYELTRFPEQDIVSEMHEQQFMMHVKSEDSRTVFCLQDVFDKWIAQDWRPSQIRAHVFGSEPFTEEEVADVTDVWELALTDRWRLYKFWVGLYSQKMRSVIGELEMRYTQWSARLQELKKMRDIQILKSARVIGMTTTGAARLQSALKTIQCPIVIVEEAAEVLEAHVVTSLTVNCKHVILIGDHKQLRPNPAVYDLARTYDLDVSLFERLVENSFPYAMLKNQHRMRTEIARTLMPHFYEDLRDDPSVFQYEHHIVGLTKNFAFITHNYEEKINMSRDDQKSHMNEYEGEYAIRLALYLLQQGYRPDQVTILCTYSEQMLFVRRRAAEKLGRNQNVRVEVVDNYQGEESDIIILTLVRSLNPEKKIGFLNVDNRVCVAMSRAKTGLYILGNIDFLADKCALWTNIKSSLEENGALVKDLTTICQSHGNKQVISHWKDFDSKTARGGCRLPCNYRLDCGHACSQLCHPDDCGLCFVKVDVTLPCGHEETKVCHLDMKRMYGRPCKQCRIMSL